ncbi:universal stress protein [Halobacteriales archaeon Cl-PHB]
MFDTILLATDGSDGAAAATDHAIALAQQFEADLLALSVVDERGDTTDLGESDPTAVTLQERLQATARETVDGVADRAAGRDVRCETAVVEGVPHEAIRGFAADHGADLLVLGTHGHTGLDRVLLGSVAERVVRTSDVPVVTVRAADDGGPTPSTDYETILVPTDGSDRAAAALDAAVPVVERTGATLHLLHVVDVREAASRADYSPPEKVMERLRTAGEAAVDRLADRARTAGVEVVTHVEVGDPPTAIVAGAAEYDADLVAMATAGRSGIKRVLLGSTTERVVRTADVPVLTVRE